MGSMVIQDLAHIQATSADRASMASVTGTSTNFLQDATTLSLGADVNVANVQVQSLTTLTASVTVPADALPLAIVAGTLKVKVSALTIRVLETLD